MDDLTYASASELLRMMEQRKVSSRELLELYLDRIDRYNGRESVRLQVDDAARATGSVLS